LCAPLKIQPILLLILLMARPLGAKNKRTLLRESTRLTMLVLHDDVQREYAYGPARGLPDTKVGTFTQALYDEAKKDGWTVISMKNDWKRIFAFE
jgi:hypothetical protein